MRVFVGLFVWMLVATSVRSDTTQDCGPQRSLFVVSHGWHTGLVLPRADLAPLLGEAIPAGDHVEVGWGDERFYRAGQGTFGLALRALAWSTPAVLHVVSFQGSPQRYFPGSEVVELTVPASGYGDLLAFVGGSFTRTVSGSLKRLGGGLYGASGFFQAQGRFHAFNTCNTWVASAIATTGYPISPRTTLSAAGLLSQLPDGAAGGTGCFAVRR